MINACLLLYLLCYVNKAVAFSFQFQGGAAALIWKRAVEGGESPASLRGRFEPPPRGAHPGTTCLSWGVGGRTAQTRRPSPVLSRGHRLCRARRGMGAAAPRRGTAHRSQLVGSGGQQRSRKPRTASQGDGLPCARPARAGEEQPRRPGMVRGLGRGGLWSPGPAGTWDQTRLGPEAEWQHHKGVSDRRRFGGACCLFKKHTNAS